MKCAVFNNNNNEIMIVYVSPELIQKGVTYESVFDKDIPSGLYYKILDVSELPPRETRNFWTMEINKDNADGIGLTKEEFAKKYPEYSGWAVQ